MDGTDMTVMSDEQLLQSCIRLESRGQMQLTLLSNLEDERSALQTQRELLQRRIFEVQEEARTAAMARPETGWRVYSVVFLWGLHDHCEGVGAINESNMQ